MKPWTAKAPFAVALIVCLTAGFARAAGEEGRFESRTFVDAQQKPSRYVLYIPPGLGKDVRPPVLLFLHGSGESGDNGLDQIMVGLAPAVLQLRTTFPCVTIFPQCSTLGSWNADGADAQRAMAILEQVQKEFHADMDRIYLTGLSMGGAGTYSLAAKYPEKFAAIVPLCGGGTLDMAQRFADAHLPIWSFCGDHDSPGTVDFHRQMHETLTKAGGKDRYTEYQDVGHNCWDRAYAEPELYTWLLEQSRKKPK